MCIINLGRPLVLIGIGVAIQWVGFGAINGLPITSAEPALFGVYAVDLLSRWRALRGFRKTLEDDHD